MSLQTKMYSDIGNQSAVATASPHRLIQMLLQGALDKIAIAKGAMQNNDIPVLGHNVSLAISIIDGLKMSLDIEAGGEIAENLDALYDYMAKKLLEANTKKDLNLLNEVTRLVAEIKAGWDGIEDEAMQVNAQ